MEVTHVRGAVDEYEETLKWQARALAKQKRQKGKVRVRNGGDWECVVCGAPHGHREHLCGNCGATRRTVEEAKLLQVLPRRPRRFDTAVVRGLIAPAGWDELRLLWVGAREPHSPLSRLPAELLDMIARYAAWRPPSWADSRLRWFKARARSDGVVRVRMTDSSSCWDFMDFYGLDIDYTHATKRFAVFEWRLPDGSKQRRFTFIGFWSDAVFLANASHPHWRHWFQTHMTPQHPQAT
ncbi:uncharacterized protein ACA1_069300 [Acanthamoeba castellanii str. Neff]|uniref:RanBP2-type domain-containing protein n=1 Tax=Acanthamoeba castellanii (strain ATCC 30010 / Neff) TaxID=1257118 RepID=L8HFX2_ACACF|nr:uncharacterized protein ACA1_069300 [Acanthamoeba castellanii str. Neff]ELR23346.1 hypothetical protein ACA1_069300 [Acanthamoeba castellanii str. Neff]